jgi:hypothetical protein
MGKKDSTGLKAHFLVPIFKISPHSIKCIQFGELWKFLFLVMTTILEDSFRLLIIQEEFEDTKGVIRIRKWKNRQHNSQKKKDKRTNNDQQSIAHNTKDGVTGSSYVPTL